MAKFLSWTPPYYSDSRQPANRKTGVALRKDGHLSLWANQRPPGWRATIGLSPNEPQRLAESDDTVREKAFVMDLRTGEVREFDAFSERDFDPVGAVLRATRGPCDMSSLLYSAPWKGALSWWVRSPPSNCRSGW